MYKRRLDIMSYTVETTFTKPADKKWFAQTYPGLARRFARIDRARATGLESRNVNKIDDNSFVVTSVWASEEAYQTFLTRRTASNHDALRNAHSQANGITFETRVI